MKAAASPRSSEAGWRGSSPSPNVRSEPKVDFHITEAATSGSTPTASNRPTISANSDEDGRQGCIERSRLRCFLTEAIMRYAAHQSADGFRSRIGDVDFAGDPAGEKHDDAMSELDDLVEVGADHHHARIRLCRPRRLHRARRGWRERPVRGKDCGRRAGAASAPTRVPARASVDCRPKGWRPGAPFTAP